MPIITKPKHLYHKPGILSGEISVSLGTSPTTIDLSNADYLIGTIFPATNKKTYCSWGDSINTSTAVLVFDGLTEHPSVFDYLESPIPDSNLTFQSEIEGGQFNYQTAQIVVI